jgi:hypothetical protein
LELKALEDWLDSLEPEGSFQEISIPEETCQLEGPLGEYGKDPVEGMKRVNLSEGEDGKKLSEKKTTEVEDETEWKVNAMRDERDTLGDQCDFPKDMRGMQQTSLQ